MSGVVTAGVAGDKSFQGNVVSIELDGGLIDGVGGGSKDFMRHHPRGGHGVRGEISPGFAVDDPLGVHNEPEPRHLRGEQGRPRKTPRVGQEVGRVLSRYSFPAANSM